MSTPYKCIICQGRGVLVKGGDIDDVPGQNTPCRICHACDGKGIVWSKDTPPVPYPQPYYIPYTPPPYYFTYPHRLSPVCTPGTTWEIETTITSGTT